MASARNSSLFCQALGGLLMEDRFSDVTIVCQDVTFKAHCSIICTQSHFFDAALKHNFQESISRTINLPEDDPETIRRVLCFFYQQTYDGNDQEGEPKCNISGNCENLLSGLEHKRAASACNSLSVYLAADKFGIFPLKEFALYKLSAWLERYYMSSSFPKIVLQIMVSMLPHDSSLLNVLVDVISGNFYELGCNKEILDIIRDHGELASLIIARVVEKKIPRLPIDKDIK
ncbi:hypothetical protein LT330_000962 [Penicillium expansum]|nr:hypothetical protein LT330_000962 [Penicillium expansum]